MLSCLVSSPWKVSLGAVRTPHSLLDDANVAAGNGDTKSLSYASSDNKGHHVYFMNVTCLSHTFLTIIYTAWPDFIYRL